MRRDHRITLTIRAGQTVCGTCGRPVALRTFGPPILDAGWVYPSVTFYAHARDAK
jgi:hypothetical protein